MDKMRFWRAFVGGFFELREKRRKLRDLRRSIRNIRRSLDFCLRSQEELLKAWDRENELRRDQEEDFQAEREMLHKLLEEANALIDPEEHADWTARVDAVLTRCDDAGRCVGYPVCDGDLPGEPHDAECAAATTAWISCAHCHSTKIEVDATDPTSAYCCGCYHDVIRDKQSAKAEIARLLTRLEKLNGVWRLSGNPSDWERADELRALLTPPVEPQAPRLDLSKCRTCGEFLNHGHVCTPPVEPDTR